MYDETYLVNEIMSVAQYLTGLKMVRIGSRENGQR